MIAAPAFLMVARHFSLRIKNASREQRRRSGAVITAAEESLGNIALVQAYDYQAAEVERFHEKNVGRFTAAMAATRLRALFQPLTGLLEIIGVVLVMGLGVWELQQGQPTGPPDRAVEPASGNGAGCCLEVNASDWPLPVP